MTIMATATQMAIAEYQQAIDVAPDVHSCTPMTIRSSQTGTCNFYSVKNRKKKSMEDLLPRSTSRRRSSPWCVPDRKARGLSGSGGDAAMIVATMVTVLGLSDPESAVSRCSTRRTDATARRSRRPARRHGFRELLLPRHRR